jgi:hypothetical protein
MGELLNIPIGRVVFISSVILFLFYCCHLGRGWFVNRWLTLNPVPELSGAALVGYSPLRHRLIQAIALPVNQAAPF